MSKTTASVLFILSGICFMIAGTAFLFGAGWSLVVAGFAFVLFGLFAIDVDETKSQPDETGGVADG